MCLFCSKLRASALSAGLHTERNSGPLVELALGWQSPFKLVVRFADKRVIGEGAEPLLGGLVAISFLS
jgi:hypothetical protein